MIRANMTALCLTALAGCVQPEPSEPISKSYNMADPAQWCAAASEALADPWLNAAQQQAILDGMRNRKCMG